MEDQIIEVPTPPGLPVEGGVIENASQDQFALATGMNRPRAMRMTSTVLMQIGAALPDGLTIPQQLSAAINVLGMSYAEVIAGTGAPKEARDALIADINAYILRQTDELVADNERMRQQAAFANDTAENLNDGGPTKSEIN